jgi:hypothetical protein
LKIEYLCPAAAGFAPSFLWSFTDFAFQVAGQAFLRAYSQPLNRLSGIRSTKRIVLDFTVFIGLGLKIRWMDTGIIF